MRSAINEDRRLTRRELEDLGIPRSGTKRLVANFIPRLLSRERKEFRGEIADDLLPTANNDPHGPHRGLSAPSTAQ